MESSGSLARSQGIVAGCGAVLWGLLLVVAASAPSQTTDVELESGLMCGPEAVSEAIGPAPTPDTVDGPQSDAAEAAAYERLWPDGSLDGGEDDGECRTDLGCSNFNANYPSGTLSTTSPTWTVVSNYIYGGDYAYYSVTSGYTYEWSLCSGDGGSATYDTQLTLWNQGGSTRYCYSDDYCANANGQSVASKIRWTATFGGTVRVLVSLYNCANNATNTTLVWRCASCSSGQADLTPYQPGQWNDEIPVGITQLNGPDTHSYTGPYYSNQTLYFNWAAINQGTAPATGYTVHVEVSGTGGNTWDWSGLTTNPGYYTYLTADQSVGPLSVGTHTFKVWVDYYGNVPESNESNNYYERTITVQTAPQADLTPYQLGQWNDKIPVGITQLNGLDTHSYSGPYYDNQTLYFNWASYNQGNASATGYTVHFEVSGTGGNTWNWTGLTTNPAYYTYLTTDQSVGPLSVGTHTFKFWVDYSGSVPESNESNNYYERTITVQTAPQADLTPYLVAQWNDKIPIGITALGGLDTHSYSGPYYDNQTLYFNWASMNQGAAAATGYTVHVQVTGTGGNTWNWNSLTTNPGYFTYVTTDQSVGPLSAGQHTFQLWVDYNNNVSESNETNNYYERTITVQTPCLVPDNCTNALAFSAVPYGISMDTACATADGPASHTCASGHRDKNVWFAFTPTVSGNYAISTCGSTYDTVLRVYTGSCGALNEISGGCSDDNGPDCSGSAASLVVPLVAGTTYRIEVASYYGGGGGLEFSVEQRADVTNYQMSGWNDVIPIGIAPLNGPDPHTYSGPYNSNQTLYYNWASRNAGDVAAAGYTVHFEVSGTGGGTWNWDNLSTPAGWMTYLTSDQAVGPLSEGAHTFKVWVDYYDSVNELYETNNYYERTIDVMSGSVPDIRVVPTALTITCGTPRAGSDAGQAGARREALVVVSAAARAADVIGEIQAHGGVVFTRLSERILWCSLPPGTGLADQLAGRAIVAADRSSAAPLLDSGDPLVAAAAVEFLRATELGRDAWATYDAAHPPINDAWDAPGLTFGQRDGNTGDMTDSVTVAVLFVESDGSIDPNTYTWTAADESSILSSVSAGLAWWAARATDNGCGVSFNVVSFAHTDARVQQGYEPVTRPSSDAHLWVSAVMGNFGYTNGDDAARVREFNDWLRSNYQTSRSYTAFVCYNPSPAPDQYTDGYAAWAFLGGPYTNLLFRSFGWPFQQVFSHETGHIFTACDEYFQAGYGGCTSCDLCSHGVDNGNCEFCNPNAVDCMMRGNSWTLCTFTPGHLGWENCSGTSVFTIFNDGPGTLNVDSVSKPTWLTLNPAPPYAVAAGGSQPVTAQFECGTCSGSDLDGNLSIHSNDPDENPVSVSVHVDCPTLAGSVRVTLLPPEAVSAGAQWAVDGGAWKNSGVEVFGLSVGTHTITYKPVSGWDAPSSEQVQVHAGQTTSLTRYYTAQVGTITVDPAPDILQAPWTLHGPSAYYHVGSGDATLVGLTPGYYTVTWGSVLGWTEPVPNPAGQTLPANGWITFSGTYTAFLGDLNCDGNVDFDDINPFVVALSDPAVYQQAYPYCNILNGDCDYDGAATFDDINCFVGLLTAR